MQTNVKDKFELLKTVKNSHNLKIPYQWQKS